MNTLNSKEAYIEMNKAAEDWSKWAEKVIILDEGKKAMFAKCFLKHKLDTKTAIEAEHKARLDPEYKEMPMTEARPSAPEHAKPIEMNDLDDDLPPF